MYNGKRSFSTIHRRIKNLGFEHYMGNVREQYYLDNYIKNRKSSLDGSEINKYFKLMRVRYE